MKQLLIKLVAWPFASAILFAPVYLGFALYAVSLNIADWNEFPRVMAGMALTFGSLGALAKLLESELQ